MATKTCEHSFVEKSFTTSENQYYNLNLNESEKCATLIAVQSNSKPNNDKYYVSDNYEEKEKSQSWNKTSKISSLNGDNDGFKQSWKNGNTLKTTNKSTLSFHISAYKNPITLDLFDNENIGSIKTSKQSFTGPFKSQNPFEFPRQQDGDKKNEPDVMQFNTSQKLLDSERPSSSQQTAQSVQPQMAPGYDAINFDDVDTLLDEYKGAEAYQQLISMKNDSNKDDVGLNWRIGQACYILANCSKEEEQRRVLLLE
uniref:Uncharacterized protein n=1 Tax=Panagrolaimus sp. PS1159 TaxID=55785 RepID=A0AC35F2X7_9BILA